MVNAAATALGKIGDIAATDALKRVAARPATTDDERFLVDNAREALSLLGLNPKAGQVEFLRTGADAARPEVAQAFMLLIDDPEHTLEARRRLLAAGPAVVPAVAAMLEWRPESCLSVLGELAGQGSGEALDVIVAALGSPRPQRRAAAARACGKAGDPRAVPALEAALQDDYHVEVVVSEASDHITDDFLRDALSSTRESWPVREAAAGALDSTRARTQ